jgi:hypothetical protein
LGREQPLTVEPVNVFDIRRSEGIKRRTVFNLFLQISRRSETVTNANSRLCRERLSKLSKGISQIRCGGNVNLR